MKHIEMPTKNCSFRPQFLKKKYEHRDHHFFLISVLVMKQRTDCEKISQFLGRIRTVSSYLKVKHMMIQCLSAQSTDI